MVQMFEYKTKWPVSSVIHTDWTVCSAVLAWLVSL
jgi:hypothetical protein